MWLILYIQVVYEYYVRVPVAQSVEHLTFNQGVTGSNPVGHTNILVG